MPVENAKIVELSAYAPLTTSTILDTLFIPAEDILILKDQDSFFTFMANVVAEDYEGFERCVDEAATEKARQRALDKGTWICREILYTIRYSKVLPSKRNVSPVSKQMSKIPCGTAWGLMEAACLPEWVNGMALLRNHF